MYDVRRLFSEGKTGHVVAVVALVVFVVGFVSGYLLGLRNVSNHGSGADTVGNQLAETGTAIQHAKDGISEAQGTAGAVAGTVADAQDTAEYISGTVNDSAELIADCQRLIEAVRRRGTEKATHN